MHVVLVNPEIAPNTGNIVRLCANTGAHLHLVEPLGFALDDRLLRRAGLDYHEFVDVRVHESMDAVERILPGRWFAFTSAGRVGYSEVTYRHDDVLVFGAERAGLSKVVLEWFSPERRLVIPMQPQNRSLNLANAVAVVVYEAWRQADYIGAASPSPDASPPLDRQQPGTDGLTSETPGADPFDS